ncbi:MAG: sigma-70 family RNA polymerase sigma factor [Candidatus Bipolaricaulota bacterium]
MRSDEALICAVARGDRTAFHELYQRHAERVYRFARSLVWNGPLAEEVLQETMLAVWKQAGRFRGNSKLSTWILGIARNQAHALQRREARGARTPDIAGVEPDPSETVEIGVRVQRALRQLSAEHREALHLVFFDELSVADAAAVLGVPEGTLKSRLFYARKALSKELR